MVRRIFKQFVWVKKVWAANWKQVHGTRWHVIAPRLVNKKKRAFFGQKRVKEARFQQLPRRRCLARATLAFFSVLIVTDIMHLLDPVTNRKVCYLLEHVQIEGSVLDGCGSRTDAVSHILLERGGLVTTNDVNRM